MFPSSNSYDPADDDDLDVDLSQFELRPAPHHSSAFYESYSPPPSPDDKDDWPPRIREGKRNPLPTRWSPPPNRSASPQWSPPVTRGRPPSPTESISDKLTRMMLAPPSPLPPKRAPVSPAYQTEPSPRRRSPSPIHYQRPPGNREKPPSPSDYIAQQMMAPFDSPPQTRNTPVSPHYRTEPPPRRRSPSSIHHRTNPGQHHHERLPSRHPTPPRYAPITSTDQRVPRPPTPPRGHNITHPMQHSLENSKHESFPYGMAHGNYHHPDRSTVSKNPHKLTQNARHVSESSSDDMTLPRQQRRKKPPSNKKMPSSVPPPPPVPFPSAGPTRRDDPIQSRHHTMSLGPPSPSLPYQEREMTRSHNPSKHNQNQKPQKDRSRTLNQDNRYRSLPHRERPHSQHHQGTRNQKPDKVRDFPSYDSKPPSPPMPDYEDEALSVYIPRPDYFDY